jgi:hypothetical protein
MYNDEIDVTQIEVLQKWEEPFRDLLNQIWWPGYATDLMQNNPDEYAREYFYFMALYQ